MKRRSTTAKTRLLGAFLATVLCLLSCPIYAAAEAGDATTEELALPDAVPQGALIDPETGAITWSPDDLFVLEEGDKTLSELAQMTLDATTLPELLSYEEAQAKGHVHRVREQEDNLNTVVFQNTNGTKTAYIYTKPVKYMDEMGAVRDKSSAVALQADGSYAMLDNSVRAYFPKNVSAGVCVTYEEYGITVRPVTTGLLVPTQSYTDGKIVYANVFGTGTHLSYQTTLEGIKEDIVITRKTGQNEFGFVLTLDGVTPVCVDGVWYVKNDENRIIGSFGEVIVKDSAGKTVLGSMAITPANAANTYTLTLTVPQEYLQATDTQYPVYVDPSMLITESELYYVWDDETQDSIIGYYDSIVDIGVNTNLGDSFVLGPNNSSGVIYLLHDFYGQYARYADMEYYEIGNVTLHLTKKSGDDVDLAAFIIYDYFDGLIGEDGVGDIIEENLTYDETSQDYYCILFNQLFDLDNPDGTGELTDDGGWVDITTIVKEWAKCDPEAGGASPWRGFALFANTTTDSATIYATEATGNHLHYTIEYATYAGERYIYNDASGRFIGAPTGVSTPAQALPTQTSGNTSKWLFEYVGSDQYIIRSVANSDYALCYIERDPESDLEIDYLYYDSLSNDIGDGKFYWTIGSYVTIGSYIKNVFSQTVITWSDTELSLVNVESANYTRFQACFRFSTSIYVPLTDFEVAPYDWVAENGSKTFSIQTVPSSATLGWYECFSISAADEDIVTIDELGNVTGVAKGVTTITITHKLTGIQKEVELTVGQLVENGTYYIMNKKAGRFLELEDPSCPNATRIQIWDIHDGSHQKWNIMYQGSGYYSIQSVYSGGYVAVANSPIPEGASIVLTDTLSNLGLWMIVQTESKAMKFRSNSGEADDLCLSLPINDITNGGICKQYSYENDEDYRDEWYLSNVNYRLNLDVWVDGGYVDRYSECDDLDCDDPECVDCHYDVRVEKILSILREEYAKQFQICLAFSTPTVHQSLADTCPNSNYYEACTCGTVCENSQFYLGTVINKCTLHHKNIYNILADIELPDLTQTARVLFTGPLTCSVDDRYHNRLVAGVTNVSSGVCVVRYDFENGFLGELQTAFHEIGHLFDTPDHYTSKDSTAKMNTGRTANFFSEECIYGEKRSEMIYEPLDSWLCDGCISSLKKNIFNH